MLIGKNETYKQRHKIKNYNNYKIKNTHKNILRIGIEHSVLIDACIRWRTEEVLKTFNFNGKV